MIPIKWSVICFTEAGAEGGEASETEEAGEGVVATGEVTGSREVVEVVVVGEEVAEGQRLA